jgi:hypothetical protein
MVLECPSHWQCLLLVTKPLPENPHPIPSLTRKLSYSFVLSVQARKGYKYFIDDLDRGERTTLAGECVLVRQSVVFSLGRGLAPYKSFAVAWPTVRFFGEQFYNDMNMDDFVKYDLLPDQAGVFVPFQPMAPLPPPQGPPLAPAAAAAALAAAVAQYVQHGNLPAPILGIILPLTVGVQQVPGAPPLRFNGCGFSYDRLGGAFNGWDNFFGVPQPAWAFRAQYLPVVVMLGRLLYELTAGSPHPQSVLDAPEFNALVHARGHCIPVVIRRPYRAALRALVRLTMEHIPASLPVPGARYRNSAVERLANAEAAARASVVNLISIGGQAATSIAGPGIQSMLTIMDPMAVPVGHANVALAAPICYFLSRVLTATLAEGAAIASGAPGPVGAPARPPRPSIVAAASAAHHVAAAGFVGHPSQNFIVEWVRDEALATCDSSTGTVTNRIVRDGPLAPGLPGNMVVNGQVDKARCTAVFDNLRSQVIQDVSVAMVNARAHVHATRVAAGGAVFANGAGIEAALVASHLYAAIGDDLMEPVALALLNAFRACRRAALRPTAAEFLSVIAAWGAVTKAAVNYFQ